jgi:hypothetical protein
MHAVRETSRPAHSNSRKAVFSGGAALAKAGSLVAVQRTATGAPTGFWRVQNDLAILFQPPNSRLLGNPRLFAIYLL